MDKFSRIKNLDFSRRIFDEIGKKAKNILTILPSKIFARIYFRDLRIPKFSRGLNFAKMTKNREHREY